MPAVPMPRRAAPRPRRRGEQGASLVLAMLVILVLMVVVAQVFYSSMVEVGHTVAFSEGRRFSFIAEACAAEAKAALVLDLERDEASGGEGGAGGLFGDSGGGGGEDDDVGQSDEEVAADVTTNSDSELDEWANVETLVPSIGDGLTILIDVVDEDSKINLLGLWTEDEDERERQREIIEELMVEAFDGTTYAISSSDATSLVDRLEDWVEGSRSTSGRATIPKPKLKPTIAADEAAETDGEASAGVFDDEQHLFLTMGELQMIEGLAPAQLWGFVEEGNHYPGLADYLTVWSHLELKPEEQEDDPFAASPFGGGGGGQGFGEETGDEGEGDEDGGQLGGGGAGSQAQPTNNGLVNLNTAPYPVLRALAPDEIPNSYLERIVEFRDRIFEYEDELYGADGLFTQDDDEEQSIFDDDGDDDLSDEDDEEDDITRFVFTDVNSVWEKIDEEFGIEPNFDGFLQSEFTRNFTTRSQVFTIKILILEPLDDTGGDAEDARYRRRSYRTVVWRMQQSDTTQIVELVPLESFWDPRRIEDFGVDLGGLGDIRGELGGFDDFR